MFLKNPPLNCPSAQEKTKALILIPFFRLKKLYGCAVAVD